MSLDHTMVRLGLPVFCLNWRCDHRSLGYLFNSDSSQYIYWLYCFTRAYTCIPRTVKFAVCISIYEVSYVIKIRIPRSCSSSSHVSIYHSQPCAVSYEVKLAHHCLLHHCLICQSSYSLMSVALMTDERAALMPETPMSVQLMPSP